MENWIEKIRKLCDERNIPISQLEEELGFGNGYLNPKKVSDIKVNRLIKILDYIGISIEDSQVLTAIHKQDTNQNKKIPGQPVLTGHPGLSFFAPINNNFYHILIIRPFFCVLQRFRCFGGTFYL